MDNIIPTLLSNSFQIPFSKSDGHSSFNHFQIHTPGFNQKSREIDMERPKHKRIEKI